MSSPRINTKTPAADATNVYVNQLIYLVFDQTIDSATLNDNTILLYRVEDLEILDKTIAWDTSTLTATITPDVVFAQNTQYNIVVIGCDQSSTCVKNPGGENLALTVTWYFTTGTSTYDPPEDTQTETQPEDPVADTPVSKVLAPKSSTVFAINATSPENYSANLGTINGDYETVLYNGPITVTFNENVASGALVQQDWLSFYVEAVDGDPATPTGMPSGLLYNANGPTLTWDPYTYNGNNYAWKINNEVTVTVSEHVLNSDNEELGNDYRFKFTTAYRPYYCTVPKIRAVIGAFIREIPDDTIARNIFINSLEAYNIANTVYSQYLWDMDNPTFAAKMWVCCKTQYDLLYSKLLDMASVGPGQMKRLGDLSIQESTDIQAGVKGALQKALDCTNQWLKLLLGKFRRAKAKMAIKGVTSPATPPMRGVRTWTLETGRDTLGANKTLTRRIKSPGIYSDWS
jgi:hypothetical protein